MISGVLVPGILAIATVVLFLLAGMAFEAENDRVSLVTFLLGIVSLVSYTYML